MVVVTLSMEIELGWGFHHLGDYTAISPRRRAETEFLNRLLSTCEECQLPFSFDIVGHLLLDSCDGCHNGPYPNEWFSEDPGTSVDEDPMFYAPDLANKIQSSNIDHELCTHSFSHIISDNVSDKTLLHDLERAQQEHRRVCEEPATSFVPPLHAEVDSDVLSEAGIEVLRTAKRRPNQNKIKRYIERLVGPHPAFPDQFEDDLYTSTCTAYMSLTSPFYNKGRSGVHPAFNIIPGKRWIRPHLHRLYLRRSLDHAIATETPLSLWCHLWDVACEEQWAGLQLFLQDLAKYRDQGLVSVKPLRDLPEAT